MKKILTSILLLCFASLANAADYQEGIQYDILDKPASTSSEVTVFFSYFCPPCYALHSYVNQAKSNIEAQGGVLNKVPLGFIGKEMGPESQRAHALAEMLDVEQGLEERLFSSIHKDRQPPQSRSNIVKYFAAEGVSPKTVNGAIDSFSISAKVAEYDKLARSYSVRGTPTVVVNGKYKVKLSGLKSGDDLVQLIDYLAKK